MIQIVQEDLYTVARFNSIVLNPISILFSHLHSPLILLDLYINYMYQLLPPQCHLRLCVRFLWLLWQITTYWLKTQLDFNRTDFFLSVLEDRSPKSRSGQYPPAEFLKGTSISVASAACGGYQLLCLEAALLQSLPH